MCVGVLVPAWTIQPCFTLQPVFAVSLYAFFSRQQGLSTLILAEGCLVGCQGVGSFFSRAQAESVLQKCYILCSYYTYPVDACTHTWLTWLFFTKDWKVGQPKLVPAHCHEGVKVNSIVQPSSHGISDLWVSGWLNLYDKMRRVYWLVCRWKCKTCKEICSSSMWDVTIFCRFWK